MSAETNRSATLVIPVYRGWSHARALLASIDWRARPWLDVVVVDDASGDDGATALAADWPDARVIRRSENGGFAAAVNSGVEVAEGSVLVVANSDLLIEGRVLDALIERCEEDPSLILSPQISLPTGSLVQTDHPFPSPIGDTRDVWVISRLLRRWKKQDPRRTPRSRSWVVGACLVFNERVFTLTGPLDTTYHMYSEEIDWQRRAQARGIRIEVAHDLIAIHDESHGAAASPARRLERLDAIWRSRSLYHHRFSPRGLKWARLSWGLAALLQGGVFCTMSLIRPLSELGRFERTRLAITGKWLGIDTRIISLLSSEVAKP